MDNTELSKDLAACVEALGAAFGELSLSGSGYLMDDGRIVGEGVYSGDARAILAAVNFLRTHAPAIAELQARCEAAAQDLRLVACDLELLRPSDALSVEGRKAYAEKIQGIAQSLQKWPPVEDAAIDAIREAGDSDGES